MTKRTRRTKDSEVAAESPEAPESRPAEPKPAEPKPAPRRSRAKKKSADTTEKLPAFGFAKDLLAGRGAEPEPEPAVPPQDPRRIFAFADSLEVGGAEEAAPAAPVRLETWITFRLAGEIFAVPVTPVREIVRVASITRVPHAPSPIRGVTNLRGRVIPVIDLRLRIGLPAGDLERSNRVIVAGSRGRLLGLLVDAVHQVVHIDLNQAQAPPDDVMTAQSDYISAVCQLDDELILLLDLDRALIIHESTVLDAGAAEVGAGT